MDLAPPRPRQTQVLLPAETDAQVRYLYNKYRLYKSTSYFCKTKEIADKTCLKTV